MWSRFVKMIANMLGLPYNAKTQSALDQIMSAGYSVLDKGVGQDRSLHHEARPGHRQAAR
jgi:hypothetical protein